MNENDINCSKFERLDMEQSQMNNFSDINKSKFSSPVVYNKVEENSELNYGDFSQQNDIQYVIDSIPDFNQKDKRFISKQEQEKSTKEIKEIKEKPEVTGEFFLIESAVKSGNEFLSFKTYSICYKDKNNLFIKCKERRYKDFEVFRNCIKSLYPYLIIPSLPAKDFTSKLKSNIISSSESSLFYEQRKQRLEYFINLISKEPIIVESSFYDKFFNDQVFDMKDFTVKADISDSTESILIKPEIKYQPSKSYFSYFFTESNKCSLKEDTEKTLDLIYNKKFKPLQLQFTDLIKHLNDFEDNFSKEATLIKDITLSLNYIKGYKMSFDDGTSLIKKIEINESISGYLDKLIISDSIKAIENYNNLIEGLEEIFLYYYDLIKQAEDLKEQSGRMDIIKAFLKEEMINEKRSLLDFKNKFECKFINEIEKFSRKFTKDFPTLINNFNLIIKKSSNVFG